MSKDHVVPYLKDILGFIGLTDVTVIRAEGAAQHPVDAVLEKARSAVTKIKVEGTVAVA